MICIKMLNLFHVKKLYGLRLGDKLGRFTIITVAQRSRLGIQIENLSLAR